MCGRYVRKDGTALFSFFEINDRRVEWRPSYNVAPTTQIPVVRLEEDGKREMVELTWGLVPGWAKPDAKLPMMINARAETSAKIFYDAQHAVVVSNQSYTPSAKRLANATGVILMHHDDLVLLPDKLAKVI